MKNKLAVTFLLIMVVLVFAWLVNLGEFAVEPALAQTTSTKLSGYGWISGVGWLDFNQVSVGANDSLSGYAWSQGLGWLKFDSGLTGVSGQGDNFGAKLVGDGIKGWARFCNVFSNPTTCSGTTKDITGTELGGWDGWVKMHNVVKGADGNLSGFAWGGLNSGWINMSGVTWPGIVPPEDCEPDPDCGGGPNSGCNGLDDDGDGVVDEGCLYVCVRGAEAGEKVDSVGSVGTAISSCDNIVVINGNQVNFGQSFNYGPNEWVTKIISAKPEGSRTSSGMAGAGSRYPVVNSGVDNKYETQVGSEGPSIAIIDFQDDDVPACQISIEGGSSGDTILFTESNACIPTGTKTCRSQVNPTLKFIGDCGVSGNLSLEITSGTKWNDYDFYVGNTPCNPTSGCSISASDSPISVRFKNSPYRTAGQCDPASNICVNDIKVRAKIVVNGQIYVSTEKDKFVKYQRSTAPAK